LRAAFDQLILTLRDALGLSVFLVTHDLDTLYTITDRVAVLSQKKCWWPARSTSRNRRRLDSRILSRPARPRGRQAATRAGRGAEHGNPSPSF
jgi:phospholipid/cholesterol/gamma-HCH transport system ATP-binding protein